MTFTTTFRRGQVVVVRVPYRDLTGSKPRPAVVISAQAFHRRLPDVILCPISSQPRYYRNPGPGDHPLAHWSEVGLRHPSTARLSKLVAVEKTLISRVLGAMPRPDLERIERGLRVALGL